MLVSKRAGLCVMLPARCQCADLQLLSLVFGEVSIALQEQGKLVALRQMIAQGLQPPVLVFVASKERARQLHGELRFEKIHCDYLSADQSQAARAAAVDAFRAGRTWMLIATDLIGRGMDFLGVNTVVNYDFPQTKTDYIHRHGSCWACIEGPLTSVMLQQSHALHAWGLAMHQHADGAGSL